MHRHGVNKSCWTKLLSPFKAHLRGKALLSPEEELPGDEVAFTEHPLWEVCARGLDYQVCWKRQAKAGRHINRGELASFLRAEVLGARAGGDIRVAISSDSQVTLGAVSKGRSASPILNRCLKQSLPHVLGLGIYSSGGYVRSAFNPADDPTRVVALRIADIVLPVWWTALAQGNTRLFDEFLAACNLHPLQMSGFPSLNQLVMQDESVLDRSVRKSLRSFHLKIKKNLRLKAAAKVGKADAQVSKAWETCTGSGPHLTCEAQEMLTSFGREQFISHDSVWPPSQPGFLDLYSGRRGLARFAVSYGAPWVLCIDVKDGPQCDLLSPEVCKKIEHMLALGVFIFMSAAMIGTSFSRAITPAVRSFEHPDGLAGVSWRMREKISVGNSHSRWLASLVRSCINMGIGYLVENPDNSFLWLQKEWTNLPHGAAERFFKVDFCRFNTAWRRRTRFLTNVRLAHARHLCQSDHRHLVLRGRSKKHGASWAKIGEPYPRGLCALLARSICLDLGIYSSPNSLPCRSNHRRIGEAKNPGPRFKKLQPKDVSALDKVELVSRATMALGSGQFEKFVFWVKQHFGGDALHYIWWVPTLFGAVLAAYGRHWYGLGGALYNYRYLVVYCQREIPNLRGGLDAAWKIISKWEELEPVQHRRPIPLALLQAMVVVALQWQWHRVAGILLLTFHACCRPGEVLGARRANLVLPEDLGGNYGDPCFLKITKPKPGRRGLGRIQHAKVRDGTVSRFLSSLFGKLNADEALYPGTASSFRTRWRHLLIALGVPPAAKISPGCLRAGGTVELYRQGMPIMDILWALRLKNLETLQHYLQEISTDVTMIDLPCSSRVLIQNMSLLFLHFLSVHGQ
jgi:hypothetical protein